MKTAEPREVDLVDTEVMTSPGPCLHGFLNVSTHGKGNYSMK